MDILKSCSISFLRMMIYCKSVIIKSIVRKGVYVCFLVHVQVYNQTISAPRNPPPPHPTQVPQESSLYAPPLTPTSSDTQHFPLTFNPVSLTLLTCHQVSSPSLVTQWSLSGQGSPWSLVSSRPELTTGDKGEWPL